MPDGLPNKGDEGRKERREAGNAFVRDITKYTVASHVSYRNICNIQILGPNGHVDQWLTRAEMDGGRLKLHKSKGISHRIHWGVGRFREIDLRGNILLEIRLLPRTIDYIERHHGDYSDGKL